MSRASIRDGNICGSKRLAYFSGTLFESCGQNRRNLPPLPRDQVQDVPIWITEHLDRRGQRPVPADAPAIHTLRGDAVALHQLGAREIPAARKSHLARAALELFRR
jgi:hypothetical protein